MPLEAMCDFLLMPCMQACTLMKPMNIWWASDSQKWNF